MLQVLNALARMACLGCHKSYREIALQLTRSYVNRLSTLESAYSRLAPEIATECEEVISLHYPCLLHLNVRKGDTTAA